MIKRIAALLFFGFTATAHAEFRWASPFLLLYTTNNWQTTQTFSSSITVQGGTLAVNGIAYVWPPNVVNGNCLKTNGSGILSWGTCGSGSGGGEVFGYISTRNISMADLYAISRATSVETGSLLAESSSTLRGIIISTSGGLFGGTTVQGVFLVEGGTFQFRNGTNEFSITFASIPIAGQKIGVLDVTGNRALLGGVGDNAGSGSGGGNDGFGNPISTRPITATMGIDASSGVVISSLNVMGVTTSSTGFIAPSSTFTATFTGGLRIIPSTPSADNFPLFRVGSLANSTTLYLNADGNLGMGVTTPSAFMHLYQVDGLKKGIDSWTSGSFASFMYLKNLMTTRPEPTTPAGVITGVNAGLFSDSAQRLTTASGFVITQSLNAVMAILAGDTVVYPVGSRLVSGIYQAWYRGTGSHPEVGAIISDARRGGTGNIQRLYGIKFIHDDTGAGGGRIYKYAHLDADRMIGSAGSVYEDTFLIDAATVAPILGTTLRPHGIAQRGFLEPNYFAGQTKFGISSAPASSLIDMFNGSLTVRGNNAGVSADTYTIRGVPIISSTWSIANYGGFITKVTSGTIAANTTLTISAANLGVSFIGIPICAEMEGVNTGGTSIRIKDTLSETSFQVYNADIVNEKKFVCHVPIRTY